MRALLAINIATALFGLAGAGMWWWAAQMRPLIVKSLEEAKRRSRPGIGDDAVQVGDKIIVRRFARQSFWNAWAAGATAIAVLLQAIAALVQANVAALLR